MKLDRLARSVRHLTELAAELEALGIGLVVLAVIFGSAVGEAMVKPSVDQSSRFFRPKTLASQPVIGRMTALATR